MNFLFRDHNDCVDVNVEAKEDRVYSKPQYTFDRIITDMVEELGGKIKNNGGYGQSISIPANPDVQIVKKYHRLWCQFRFIPGVSSKCFYTPPFEREYNWDGLKEIKKM